MEAELTIPCTNISIGWAKAFLALMEPGRSQCHPAMVTISRLDETPEPEDLGIRHRLDAELKRHGESVSKTVAGTIFPWSMWNQSDSRGAEALYERYDKAWPGIQKCPANKNGVYFRRLMAFQPENCPDKPVNQLKFIARTYKGGNHRKSALQASVLDPTRDHTNSRQRGFPCLHQVAFTPVGDNQLSITGFYATQYQFEKAYGNYLGLYWLGRFMAKQLGLTLTQVVCLAAVLKLSDRPKMQLEGFANDLRKVIASGR